MPEGGRKVVAPGLAEALLSRPWANWHLGHTKPGLAKLLVEDAALCAFQHAKSKHVASNWDHGC